MSTETQHEAAFFRTIRSWNLTRGDARVLGGVLSGLGGRTGLAPVPARILFVVACLFIGGPLVLLYAAAWALLPDSQGRIVIQDFGRGVPQVGALVAIGILTFIGFGSLADGGPAWPWGWGGNAFDFSVDGGTPFRIAGAAFALLMGLLFAGAVVAVIVWAVRQGRKGPGSGPDAARPGQPAPAQYAVTRAEAAAAAQGATPSADPGVSSDTPSGGIPVPPVPPAPPQYGPPARPRPPRVPGPGPAGYLAALALLPISAAIAAYLHFNDQLAISPVFVAGLIFTAGIGLILVITALAGRRSGFLGFVAVMALIPTIVAIPLADRVRDAYTDGYAAWDFNPRPAESWSSAPEPVPEVPAIDPSEVLGSTYSTVVLAGGCYDAGDIAADTSLPTIRLASVTDDTSIDIATDSTRIVVAGGTSIVIESAWEAEAESWTSTHVEWVGRDISCDLTGTGTTLARLTNPDAPVLTLRMTDPNLGAFIQIEEN